MERESTMVHRKMNAVPEQFVKDKESRKLKDKKKGNEK